MVSRYVPDMGDLIWVDFDPTKGSEQAGHRPAVVLSPFMYNNKTGMCLCVPCTTQSKGYPFEVVLSGQERDGVALADQVKISPGGQEEQRRKEQLPQRNYNSLKPKLTY
ncbi:endoribonuclease MazF [Escherichia coli]|nr:endoribonuclease MazF [Escherichia coli]